MGMQGMHGDSIINVVFANYIKSYRYYLASPLCRPIMLNTTVFCIVPVNLSSLLFRLSSLLH